RKDRATGRDLAAGRLGAAEAAITVLRGRKPDRGYPRDETGQAAGDEAAAICPGADEAGGPAVERMVGHGGLSGRWLAMRQFVADGAEYGDQGVAWEWAGLRIWRSGRMMARPGSTSAPVTPRPARRG